MSTVQKKVKPVASPTSTPSTLKTSFENTYSFRLEPGLEKLTKLMMDHKEKEPSPCFKAKMKLSEKLRNKHYGYGLTPPTKPEEKTKYDEAVFNRLFKGEKIFTGEVSLSIGDSLKSIFSTVVDSFGFNTMPKHITEFYEDRNRYNNFFKEQHVITYTPCDEAITQANQAE